MPKRQLRRLRRAAESSESAESSASSSASDDTEGSLADFIEHDSAELEDDESYTESSEEGEVSCSKRPRLRGDESDEEDEGDEDEATTQTEEDPDDAIRRQYSPEMEQRGSVVTETGVRRSMRSTKGKAPQRYVDEDYADLMLEDISPAEQALLAQEFTSSSEGDEGDGEFDDLGDEDDDEEDAQVQRP